MHAAYLLLQCGQCLRREAGLHRAQQMAAVIAMQQGALGGVIGVAQADAHQKAIQL